MLDDFHVAEQRKPGHVFSPFFGSKGWNKNYFLTFAKLFVAKEG